MSIVQLEQSLTFDVKEDRKFVTLYTEQEDISVIELPNKLVLHENYLIVLFVGFERKTPLLFRGSSSGTVLIDKRMHTRFLYFLGNEHTTVTFENIIFKRDNAIKITYSSSLYSEKNNKHAEFRSFVFRNCVFETKVMEFEELKRCEFIDCTFKISAVTSFKHCKKFIVFTRCKFTGNIVRPWVLSDSICDFNNCEFETKPAPNSSCIYSRNYSSLRFNGCKIVCQSKFILGIEGSSIYFDNCDISGECKNGSAIAVIGNGTYLDIRDSNIEFLNETRAIGCDFFALVNLYRCRISGDHPSIFISVRNFAKLWTEYCTFNVKSGIVCKSVQGELELLHLENESETNIRIDVDPTSKLRTDIEKDNIHFGQSSKLAKVGDMIDKRNGRVISECELDSVPESDRITICEEEEYCVFCLERRPVMMCPFGHFCGCKECLRKWKPECPFCWSRLTINAVPVQFVKDVSPPPLPDWMLMD